MMDNIKCFKPIFQVAREKEVEAEVKLQFKDVTGQLYVAQRVVTATQKVWLEINLNCKKKTHILQLK